MCGIAGYYGPVKPRIMQLQLLWLLLQERGADAAGAFWEDGHKTWFAKHSGSPAGFLSHTRKWWTTASYVLLHTRLATQGPASNNANNHPIMAHDWAVTHNGVIWNDDAIPTKRRKTQCDSEAINWFARQHGIEKALTEDLLGWYTIAAVNLRKPKTVYLYTMAGELFISQEENNIAWASDEEYLQIAGFPDVKPVEKGILYVLNPTGIEERDIGMPWDDISTKWLDPDSWPQDVYELAKEG